MGFFLVDNELFISHVIEKLVITQSQLALWDMNGVSTPCEVFFRINLSRLIIDLLMLVIWTTFVL